MAVRHAVIIDRDDWDGLHVHLGRQLARTLEAHGVKLVYKDTGDDFGKTKDYLVGCLSFGMMGFSAGKSSDDDV